jgi:glyoxylase-like metal-dependent hydrolase (beta-lactamase superfamily II)
MSFHPLDWDKSTLITDSGMFNTEEFGAIYLIEDDKVTMVESGTSFDTERILSAVREFGHTPGDIDNLIVSHIHLDHAGGAGFLLQEMKNARVFVHERGYKHLVDPTRLLASARAALGASANEFGTMRPIPAERLVAVKDGDKLELGKRELIFYDSPGHAPHELTIFDTYNKGIYTGDAAGLYLSRDEVLMPIAPAPTFSLEDNIRSLDRMLTLQPRALFFSHYGPHTNPKAVVTIQKIQYAEWADFVRRRRGLDSEESMTEELFRDYGIRIKAYEPGFVKKRIRDSVEGLIVYHQRLEDAARKI